MNAPQPTSTVTRLESETHTGSTQALTPAQVVRSPGSSATKKAGPPDGVGSAHLPGADPLVPRARLIRPGITARSIFGTVILLAGLGYLAARYISYSRSWVTTDNAYVAGHIHSVSSRVTGTVQEVLVDENDVVTNGTVLARLDPLDFEVKHEQALAQLAQAAAQVQETVARIAQAEAQVAHDQARATRASNDLARARTLFESGSGAISRQELDLATSEADAAEAGLQGARSAGASARAVAVAAQAQEKVARATLHDAELQLSYTQILAPSSGRIGKRNVEVGNRVQPGQALLALVGPDVWVTANFKETQLAHLKPGQPVRIKADAFPGRTLRGTVDGVSPASGSQFALLPPDNATGNFTKIVQRVPVKVRLNSAELGDFAARLVAGMSVVVEINVSE